MTTESQPKFSIEPQAVMEMMRERGSIRAYKPDAIPPEYVEMILEAGRWAPNGEDEQPWRFIVVDDKETILKLGVLAARDSGSNSLVDYLIGDAESAERVRALPLEKREKEIRGLWSGGLSGFVGDAPLVIVCCHQLNYGADNPMDLAAATMNMCLIIHALGLGESWTAGGCTSIRAEQEVHKLLNMPDDWYASYLLSIGFPAESPAVGAPKPVSEIACRNKFGEPYPFPSKSHGRQRRSPNNG